ncbi:MAG TPA: hypothetical protein VKA19_07240 [Alphaproteobacteria bacterium]|nr:hypothetical protein [Alphaproteobacteria bacterium]
MTTEKFFLKSKTVWGVMITFLTTAWGPINSFLGLDIGVDMITTFGQQGTQVIQAVGAFVGTAMVIWGRFAARDKLTMKP